MPNNIRMKTFVTELLKENLSTAYYYHNIEHTLYVTAKAIEIGKNEGCTPKELQLLETAALWHDTGFINTYVNHEKEGCKIAKKHLPYFGFSKPEISIVCGMIMATKIPQSPKNKLEEIIADADLEYLGTKNAQVWSKNLYKELSALNPLLTQGEWHKIEIDFISVHHYFTNYCRKNNEEQKQLYLEKLVKKKI